MRWTLQVVVQFGSRDGKRPNLEQESEPGIAVWHMLPSSVLRVHQAHDDLKSKYVERSNGNPRPSELKYIEKLTHPRYTETSVDCATRRCSEWADACNYFPPAPRRSATH